ncbi:class I SAM-dependent methyltransferase [Catenulispora subtropica]|uniref:class I SAM-dependent methyltransferase n=1 Tax=Catenulispora subtropica TaxID=450798 RepID=UPI0031D31D08
MDFSEWMDYNAAQTAREVRPLLLDALTAAGPGAGRQAVDLGCGLGRESDALLRAGWRVHAVDFAPNTEENLHATTREQDRERLTVEVRSFADLAGLPDADLVYAGFSIPYIPRDVFDRLIGVVRTAVRPGGLFAANLLGVNDGYRAEHGEEFTFLDEDEVRSLLFPGWDLVRLDIEDYDGRAYSGPHHWHLFHLVARRP